MKIIVMLKFTQLLGPYIYIYIYIYVCVCVCVCVYHEEYGQGYPVSCSFRQLYIIRYYDLIAISVILTYVNKHQNNELCRSCPNYRQ